MQKRMLVTGASSGIGKVTALELARQGVEVILVCRSSERGEAAMSEIRERIPDAKLHLLLADLSSMEQVRRVAAEVRDRFDRLDVLINNAGAIFGERGLTEEGVERTFALNHLAYFVLTFELRTLLEDSAPSRIVNVASAAHQIGKIHFDDIHLEKGYSQFKAYAQSKLANVLFTQELAHRFRPEQVTANALHPGTIGSGFGSSGSSFFRWLTKLGRPFLKRPASGARLSVKLACSEEVAGVTGAYFSGKKARRPAKPARDPEAAQDLWALSEQMTGVRWSRIGTQTPN